MGFVYLFTGNGKGKTEASIGAAIRARGYGKKVVFIQFMKGLPTGEVEPLRGAGVEVYRFGRESFVDFENPSDEDIKLAHKGLEQARDVIKERPFLVILDEVNVATAIGLLDVKDILSIIETLPEETNLILTGRYASDELIDAADVVTEMKEVKHYFKEGVQPVKGIDY